MLSPSVPSSPLTGGFSVFYGNASFPLAHLLQRCLFLSNVCFLYCSQGQVTVALGFITGASFIVLCDCFFFFFNNNRAGLVTVLYDNLRTGTTIRLASFLLFNIAMLLLIFVFIRTLGLLFLLVFWRIHWNSCTDCIKCVDCFG